MMERGTILNKVYKVVTYLGRGSMGDLYLLERIKDGRSIVAEEFMCPRSHIFFKEVIGSRDGERSALKYYSFLSPEGRGCLPDYTDRNLIKKPLNSLPKWLKPVKWILLPLLMAVIVLVFAGTMAGFLGEWSGLLMTLLLSALVCVISALTMRFEIKSLSQV